MTLAVLGSGATLQLGSGASPQVYTTIAEVLRCGPIGSTNPEVDVTNLDSTAKEYKKKNWKRIQNTWRGSKVLG